MFLTKVKSATASLLAVCLVAGTASLTHRVLRAEEDEKPLAAKPASSPHGSVRLIDYGVDHDVFLLAGQRAD